MGGFCHGFCHFFGICHRAWDLSYRGGICHGFCHHINMAICYYNPDPSDPCSGICHLGWDLLYIDGFCHRFCQLIVIFNRAWDLSHMRGICHRFCHHTYIGHMGQSAITTRTLVVFVLFRAFLGSWMNVLYSAEQKSTEVNPHPYKKPTRPFSLYLLLLHTL